MARRGTQHLGQQFQRQADHVRLAPLEHVDPAEPILVAERAGLPLPLPAGQIFLHLRRREGIHAERGGGHADLRPASRRPP